LVIIKLSNDQIIKLDKAMPNLKEVRIRIASVISTQQITSAMKMVSASKLRRAQDAIIQMRPFEEKLKEILDSLILSAGSSAGVFAQTRPAEKILIAVITSNRGLCGGFNSNVIKGVNQLIREKYPEQAAKGDVSIVCVGKKGSDFFKKNNFKVITSHNELWDKLNYDNVAEFAGEILKLYADGKADRVEVVYNRFKNAATQILSVDQLLPFHTEAAPENIKKTPSSDTKKESNTKPDYIFEPDKEEIIQNLIPYALKVRFYRSMLDSYAAEHGARMTAMHKATDNASEMIKSLKLSYNKARQAAITKEILEIVAGAEAINS
jgi:F-type H+-transporting ATPase subunit gamma